MIYENRGDGFFQLKTVKFIIDIDGLLGEYCIVDIINDKELFFCGREFNKLFPFLASLIHDQNIINFNLDKLEEVINLTISNESEINDMISRSLKLLAFV